MASGGQAMTGVPYCGVAPTPMELLDSWNFDPVLLAVLIAGTIAACRSGVRNGWAFATGIGVLAVLFVSPFCALTSALFAARSAHHVMLVAIAAPLLVWSFPATARRLPVGASAVAAAIVLWAWHVPALYAAALSRDDVYWVMQASLLISALVFWAAIRAATVPAAVVALLGTMVQMGLLGALLTSTSAAVYLPHLLTTYPWGMNPLEDQQLGGLIMWAPAAAIYLGAALLLAGRWLGEERGAVA